MCEGGNSHPRCCYTIGKGATKSVIIFFADFSLCVVYSVEPL